MKIGPPHVWCIKCASTLSHWMNGKRKSMPFAVPMIWREQTNHVTDCFFYTVEPVRGGLLQKKKRDIDYTNIPSALRPVPHCEDLPIPKPPTDIEINSDDDEEYTEPLDPGPRKSRFHEHSNEEYINFSDSTAHIIATNDLNDLITSQSKFDVTFDRFASRLAAEFIIFMEFFSLILGVDQLAASRLQLDSRNLPEFL
ncbi:hypothetical protein AVEN_144579-1 [Araneus ventricosus]|uniref:Uncharacterized protein n=1 Tax=Araneus ventricosus TaxID=182803 RepID=A0A4Y2BZ87_ARAVE|nr:hypothetical protein AVEN_144579-1 [Araneus ventricosus]